MCGKTCPGMIMAVLLVATGSVVAPAGAGVREDFANPPPESRLQAWYHWTTTGITDECLAADLKAMGELGIGTAHVFMPGQQPLPPNTQPLSEEWWKRWETAIREAKKNGIKLGFHNCPGWSSSGGNWIKPEDSMKVLVAAATDVDDLSKSVKLAEPVSQMGFYRDVAVYAFPIERPVVPTRVSGDFEADFEAFMRGGKPLELPTAEKDPGCTLAFEYDHLITPTSLVTCWDESQFHLDFEVSASADGSVWKTIAEHKYRLYNCQLTPKVLPLRECPPSRFFRIKVSTVQPPVWVKFIRRKLVSAVFTSLPLVSEIDDKNGASVAIGYRAPADPAEAGIPRASIADVTRHMRADGTLQVPAGEVSAVPDGKCWRILRVGYTTTGKMCAPAPSNVRGLECDKLTKKGLDAHWPHMPRKMFAAPGGKGTVAVSIVDSWEVGGQNWTEDFPAEFKRRRGYDIRPWLPAMAGYTVGTAGETAKFLFDVQRTVSDLMAENYFDYFAELCHREGALSATESYGGPFDTQRAFMSADVPTGEFWLGRDTHYSPRLAASAGHVNGRRQIAAEAFTSDPKEGRWQATPHELRVSGDRGWLEGISQIVYHSYVQQPYMNVQPGFSLWQHGSQLNRHTTWWPEGKWWAQYVHRGQFILQSGKPKADVLMLAGDGSPNGASYQADLVDAGYSYDCCGAADLQRLEVRDGGVAMPGCSAYDVLCLGKDRYLTCATLRKVKALLEAGVRVSGKRPSGTPTLSDDSAEWKRLADEIWSGRFNNLKTDESALGAARSFGLRAPVESGGKLAAIRRVIEGRDFCFVMAAKKGEPFEGEVSFAASGRPECWDAKTGKIEPLPWIVDEEGRVKAHLSLRADESMFVSFRKPTAGERPASAWAGAKEPSVEKDVSSDWTIVSFAGKNAPAAPLAFPKLTGWNESADERLKYFAGRAVYERKVDLGGVKEPCDLDLGDVREIANVWVDGEFLGCLWEAPYRTALPKSALGKSVTLRVEVVNTWPNRLIGDSIARKRGAAEPRGEHNVPQWVLDDKPDSGTGIYTWASWLKGWNPEDALRPAGLLGPVRVLRR
ncbi:MAG: hypothetical protein IJI73_08575 [Kiritimatiellae bacterium]|nr:hypothetical protein [Kiritimatiellia bacterium]